MKTITGDFLSGFASMLVALPSAMAFGIIIYAPLGVDFSTRGAVVGIIGTIAIGLIAPLFGGAPKLISAPCAPAAAVLSAFVAAMAGSGGSAFQVDSVPSVILVTVMLCGALQLIIGAMGAGSFIKYIPYPVVAGYLSGVGILIIIGQIPQLFGTGKNIHFLTWIISPGMWQWKGMLVGLAAMAMMFAVPRLTKIVPATIFSLIVAVIVYWILALWFPEMSILKGNAMIVGPIGNTEGNYLDIVISCWKKIPDISLKRIAEIAVTGITLSILLSIDTLKTCVVMDALTRSRHNSNKELISQGIANLISGIAGGIPGAGTMGSTLINISSGARSSMSGLWVGIFSLLVFLVMGPVIAWVPLAALAGILIVVGMRMIDLQSFLLLKHKTTVFDFIVYVIVILTALFWNLIAAAGAGIFLSIMIFVRDQVRQSVIRRKVFGNQIFSKKRRLPDERQLLEKNGGNTLAIELQGPLFFGTADQLLNELEPHLPSIKYLILDMRRVHSVDYTAVHRLDQIEHSLSERNGAMVFTSVPLNLPTGQNVQKYLEKLGLSRIGRSIRFFKDLDEGLQWAEEKILDEASVGGAGNDRPLSLAEIHIFSGLEPSLIDLLATCVKEKKFESSERIFSKGDTGKEIFFIRQGTVHIHLPLAGGMYEHLATFGMGDFFGDMAFLVTGERSADAVAEDDVSLYILSRPVFDKLTANNPRLGEIVFERLASALVERLRENVILLKTLIEC